MPPSSTAWTRESFLARLSDLLRRTATEDCEELVRLLEVNLPAVIQLDGLDEARRLARDGRKIEAIKIVREKLGLGLKEAKDTVEAPGFLDGFVTGPPPPDQTPGMDEVRRLVAEGRMIDAIKRYREETGAGLRESKDACEAMKTGGVR